MSFVRKTALFSLAVALLLGLVFGAAAGCAPPPAERLSVVTSTSLLTYLVERVGGDLVEVAEVVPPTQHPGNYDASPGDIQRLAGADLFLVHGWPGETFVPGLVEAAQNDDLRLVTIAVKGNWMTPAVQMEAADLVAQALAEADPDNAAAYRRGAEGYRAAVTAKQREVEERLQGTGVAGTKALVSFWQAGFARWLGMEVVATYGPAELTPQDTREAIDTGRENGVRLVIDNLQSAPDAGAGIAADLGCARVTLSNFPGGYPGTETWEAALDRNVELVLEALQQ